MSNPTSNFGWQMPTPTDLVTDLPADFEVFGQAVDSSMADLKGGTSGQILSKATNTDMDFTWIDNQVGDITAVTADAPLTGGGTTGAISIGIQDATTSQKGAVQLTDSTSSTSDTTAATPKNVKAAYDLAAAAIPASTATTAGDILFRNGSAVTRLGIGTAGQVLKVNSGATAPEWGTAGSGGGTVASTGSFSGSSTAISIPSGYNRVALVFEDIAVSTTAQIYLKPNNTTGLGNFNVMTYFGASFSYFYAERTVAGELATNGGQNVSTASSDNDFNVTIDGINGTGDVKPFQAGGSAICTGNGGARAYWLGNGYFKTTSPITSITVATTSGTFTGTWYLIGLN